MDWGGVIGRLAGSSGQVGGYEMVVGVGDCFRSRWVVEGHLACSFGENKRQKHGSQTMGSRW